MALGGGQWTSQNMLLPGSYINFVKASRAGTRLSRRGTAAIPIECGWGPEDQIITLCEEDFRKNCELYFLRSYDDALLAGIRDLFTGADKLHFMRLDKGGRRAESDFAEVKYPGKLGNNLFIDVSEEVVASGAAQTYTLKVCLNADGKTVVLETFTNLKKFKDMGQSKYIELIGDTGMNLYKAVYYFNGGTDGTVSISSYQSFLDKIEPYDFNVLATVTTDKSVQKLFWAFTERMRDDAGVKFQCVMYDYTHTGTPSVVSVGNKTSPVSLYDPLTKTTRDITPWMVYWFAGASAGCELGSSLTNKLYDGELVPYISYTQAQLEAFLSTGTIVLHMAGQEIRVLEDINTSKDGDLSGIMRDNQTVRLLDQIALDIASLFQENYLGRVPNDQSGRISLWNDIVKHHQELERLRAIEDFSPEDVSVESGDDRKSVVITDKVTPTGAMTQLYMSVIVA